MGKILIFIVLASIFTIFFCNNKLVDTMKESNTDNKEVVYKSTDVKYDIVQGYFLKNTVKLKKETTGFVFNTSDSLLNTCGMAATMSVKPDVINFENETGVAVAYKETNYLTNLSITKIELLNNELNVFVDVKQDLTNALSYTSIPFVLVKFANIDFNRVNFYYEKNKIEK